MRFFEFTLPDQGSDFSAQIETELNNLSKIVDEKPEIEAKVNHEYISAGTHRANKAERAIQT